MSCECGRSKYQNVSSLIYIILSGAHGTVCNVQANVFGTTSIIARRLSPQKTSPKLASADGMRHRVKTLSLNGHNVRPTAPSFHPIIPRTNQTRAQACSTCNGLGAPAGVLSISYSYPARPYANPERFRYKEQRAAPHAQENKASARLLHKLLRNPDPGDKKKKKTDPPESSSLSKRYVGIKMVKYHGAAGEMRPP